MNKKIKTFLKYGMCGVVVFTLFVFSGCGNDEEPAPTKTVWQLMDGNSDLSMIKEQLAAAGLDDQLNGAGQFTLFAPSNAAMTTLLTTLGLSDFSSVSEQVIQAVLSYHIVASQVLYENLSGSLITLEGESITVIGTGDDKQLDTGASNDADITQKNIKGTNGVIHIISTVIVPPTIGDLIVKTLGTVAQPLLLAKDFTIYAAAIKKAETYALTNAKPALLGTLESKGILIKSDIITVFAETNAVFGGIGVTADSFEGSAWYGILLNHIVPGDYHQSDDYTVSGELSTAAEGTLTVLTKDAPTNPSQGILTGIALDSDGDLAGGAEGQIAVLDVLAATGANPANNGYINVIAGFLAP